MRFLIPKPISIRRLLIVLAVAPTLVLATIFVLLTYRSNQVAIRNLTDGLTTEISARIDTHLKQFLDSTLSVTAIHADLIAAGQLDHHDQQQMETYFFRNMYHYPLVNSMYFGNESGGLVGSGRDGNVPYVTGTAGYTAGTFYKYAVDSEGVRTSLLSEFPDFDARNRMWFREAERQRTAVWSEPYVLFTGQDMAIAASYPVVLHDGTFAGTLAVDLFLSQLSEFLQDMNLYTNGTACIVDHDGFLVATSTGESLFTPRTDDRPPLRLFAGDSEHSIVRKAYEVMNTQAPSDEDSAKSAVIRFRVGREGFTMTTVPVKTESSAGAYPEWYSVVVLPDSDFTAAIDRNYRFVLVATVVFVLAIILIALHIASSVSRPVINLSETICAYSGGDLPPVPPESIIRELVELNRSFNTMTERLTRTLNERETLIRELNHRTKNNMNVISSMLRLQSDYIDDPRLTQVLEDLESRIQSMALVHQKLYQSGDLTHIRLDEYLTDLVDLLSHGTGAAERAISFQLHVEPVNVPVDIAVPCGLVVSELITNAMKHAFSPDSPGNITVELQKAAPGYLSLVVKDDGKGYAPDFRPREQNSLGLQTVYAIVESQLAGSVELDSDDGMRWRFTFPLIPI